MPLFITINKLDERLAHQGYLRDEQIIEYLLALVYHPDPLRRRLLQTIKLQIRIIAISDVIKYLYLKVSIYAYSNAIKTLM